MERKEEEYMKSARLTWPLVSRHGGRVVLCWVWFGVQLVSGPCLQWLGQQKERPQSYVVVVLRRQLSLLGTNH